MVKTSSLRTPQNRKWKKRRKLKERTFGAGKIYIYRGSFEASLIRADLRTYCVKERAAGRGRTPARSPAKGKTVGSIHSRNFRPPLVATATAAIAETTPTANHHHLPLLLLLLLLPPLPAPWHESSPPVSRDCEPCGWSIRRTGGHKSRGATK